jgi:hypothetical protein
LSFPLRVDFKVFALRALGLTLQLVRGTSHELRPFFRAQLLAEPPLYLIPKHQLHRPAFLEVFRPYSVSPHEAAASLVEFASLYHLRLQVFSTSWRFVPPRVCWPCFMPDPLLGFSSSRLSSFCVAVHCFQCLSLRGVGQLRNSTTYTPMSHRRNGRQK